MERIFTTVFVFFVITSVFTSLLYFFGFKAIENEALVWSLVNLTGTAITTFTLIVRKYIARPKSFFKRILKLVLSIELFFFLLGNLTAIDIWLTLKQNTDSAVGYLGNTTVFYAWPHFLLIILCISLIVVGLKHSLNKRLKPIE